MQMKHERAECVATFIAEFCNFTDGDRPLINIYQQLNSAPGILLNILSLFLVSLPYGK